MNRPPTPRRRPVLVGLGELLWDLLPGGQQLGGAPTNFAYHAQALGATARVVTRLGRDALGTRALHQLGRLGLPTDALQTDPQLPTGTAGVEVTAGGQPHFTIHAPAAWDALELTPAGREAVADADAVCFGTLGQRDPRARATLRALVAGAPSEATRLLDLNLRSPHYSRERIVDSLQLANALKLNDAELEEVAALLQLPGDERSRITRLAERSSLQWVACTRGSRGSLLYHAGQWSEHPGIPTQVADTVGAGDAFAAAMVLGFLAGWELDALHHQASQVAAFVCSQHGATPTLPDALRIPFATTTHP